MKFLKRSGRAMSAMLIAIFTYSAGCSDTSIVEPAKISHDAKPTLALSSASSSGLVAAYGFNEASGTAVVDASGYSHHGTMGSGVTRSTSGRFGGALVFNGSSMVTIPNAPSLQLNKTMTLEAWINPSVVTSAWRDVVYKGDDNYYLMATSPSRGRPAGGASFGTSATTDAFGASPVPANTWTHLAVTYDGSTLRFYVNGTQVSMRSKVGTMTTSANPLSIGGTLFYDGQFFTGLIDEVRVYNRALSVREVQTDMNTPVSDTTSSTDTQAPTVSITSPTTSSTYTTSANSVSIGGISSDNVGVTQITWSTSGGATGTAAGTTTWSANVPLQAGSNIVTVTARDAANNSATATLTVTSAGSGNSLVAAYGFNEVSGTAALDASGYGNNGTLGSGVTRSASGRFGGALLFNGSSMVTIPNAPSLQLTTTMTLEAWIKPSVVGSSWRDVVYKGDDNYYLVATSSNGGLPAGGASFGVDPTSEVFGTASVVANTWTHLAVTYDGATLRYFVNGTQVAARAKVATLTTSTNPLNIGGTLFYDGQFFTGLIDEVRVYNRALSAGEVQTDMNTPVGGTSTLPPASAATHLFIQTQPSTTVQNGVAFAQQSIIQLLDGSNNAVAQSGVVVSASIAAGGGTLGGTTTATTNASGVATFTDLSMSGLAGARTLTFSATGLTSASAAVTVSAGAATQLAIATQASATALSGVSFATQPVVQLRDGSNAAVSQSGVVVTAAIASGGGTLGGTLTATTNASGAASFTNLQISGTAGTRTLVFSAAGLTPVTSAAISVTVSSTPVAGLYPNRPASFTTSSELDFSQAVPGPSDGNDHPIGIDNWRGNNVSDYWTKTSDNTAPQSPPSVWRGHFAPGSYGGGVIGSGSGHGIGSVTTPTPSITRLYMSTRVYFDFDAADWHPISNKYIIIEADNGAALILVQLLENGDWLHAEKLQNGNSFYVDGGADFPGEDHIPGQLVNKPVPTRQWVQIEVLIDLPNHVFKVWQDGVLTTSATPNFGVTTMTTVGVHAFRGGGGETLTKDLYWKYDHFFIAW